MREDALDFGRSVRRARLAAGLTQSQLANRAGITERTVRSVEHGTTTPQRRVRDALSAVLADVVVRTRP
jgi:transcriptional regulator with XRE-family HTH domain